MLRSSESPPFPLPEPLRVLALSLPRGGCARRRLRGASHQTLLLPPCLASPTQELHGCCCKEAPEDTNPFPHSNTLFFTCPTYEDLTGSLSILTCMLLRKLLPLPSTSLRYPASGNPAGVKDPVNTTARFFQQTCMSPQWVSEVIAKSWPGEGGEKRVTCSGSAPQ